MPETGQLSEGNDVQPYDCWMCHLFSQFQVAAENVESAYFEASRLSIGLRENSFHLEQPLIHNSGRGPPNCALFGPNYCF